MAGLIPGAGPFALRPRTADAGRHPGAGEGELARPRLERFTTDARKRRMQQGYTGWTGYGAATASDKDGPDGKEASITATAFDKKY